MWRRLLLRLGRNGEVAPVPATLDTQPPSAQVALRPCADAQPLFEIVAGHRRYLAFGSV
jgi:hypothetical protein